MKLRVTLGRYKGAVARRLALTCCIIVGCGVGATAQAGDPVLVALGQWQFKAGKSLLVVPLEGALTPKQKSIINGGFTTVSQLEVREAKDGEDDSGRVVYKVRCSVKFDAWEETYDIARLDDAPRPALVKRLSEYGDLCLKAEINDPQWLGRFSQDGGTLYALLVVKQMSTDEAAKIKEWLIQQQSGVMQSLFSHMLGELTVNQTSKFKISVPPRPRDGGAQRGTPLRFGRAIANPVNLPGQG